MQKEITIGEKYGFAMEIKTKKEADAYFEECVQHNMSFGNTRKEAEKVEHINLGYFAGYYDTKTRERVERLFGAVHPIFGAVTNNVPPEMALEMGKKLALKQK